MEESFNHFFEKYLEAWRTSSLTGLKSMISLEYQAREITADKISDFGYEESIQGWEHGFNFVKGNGATWDLKEIKRIQLRDHEIMAVIIAKLIVDGKSMETYNLFFQTFSYDFGWKLIRSYIEAGIPVGQFD
ncbi:flavoprotein [Mesobacillus jeotgali]|uniref:flavoprotein n=1 Tax=Mesobacillus jeotgali TaxID=129985 RepID=UPI0009A8D565|nr:flavoprotein [Mesobacillus jeotgali]